MDKYVLGFAFNESCNEILLVKKNHPEWQKGSLNGIGGEIEDGESTTDAMNRECAEETGLFLSWMCRGIMRGRNEDHRLFKCHLFYAYNDNIIKYKQLEKEPLNIYDPKCLSGIQIMQSLNFLIPFGMHNDKDIFMTLDFQSVFQTA